MTPVTPIIPGLDLPVTEVAKKQSEYRTLPAFVDQYGTVVTRWHLTWRERFQAFFGGHLWLTVMTFNRPLQPVKMETEPRVTAEMLKVLFSNKAKQIDDSPAEPDEEA